MRARKSPTVGYSRQCPYSRNWGQSNTLAERSRSMFYISRTFQILNEVFSFAWQVNTGFLIQTKSIYVLSEKLITQKTLDMDSANVEGLGKKVLDTDDFANFIVKIFQFFIIYYNKTGIIIS